MEVVVRQQGSLQLGEHGGPPNHFEIPPNQKLTKIICFLYIIIRVMWLAPKVILSNQVDNKILVIITKPSKMLEQTLWGKPHFHFSFDKFASVFHHATTFNSHFTFHMCLRLIRGRQHISFHSSIVWCWGCEGGLISYFIPQADQIPPQNWFWAEHLDLALGNCYVDPGHMD